MRKIIHHLRRQPEEVRRHILHVSVIIFGIILFSLWVYSLGGNYSDASTETKIEKNLEPLSVLKDNLTLPEW